MFGIQVASRRSGCRSRRRSGLSFVVLAVITYVAGLRSATLIAVVKDVFIWITVLIAVIYIPIKLGGYGAVFAHVPHAKRRCRGRRRSTTRRSRSAPGSPSSSTRTRSRARSRRRAAYVIQRNSIFLPVYTVMLGLLALLGYMAIAAGIQPDAHYGNNIAVPALLDKVLPAPGSPASGSRRSRSAPSCRRR